jgi:hypothetical protein
MHWSLISKERSRVVDPYSFFPDPDPDPYPEFASGDQFKEVLRREIQGLKV